MRFQWRPSQEWELRINGRNIESPTSFEVRQEVSVSQLLDLDVHNSFEEDEAQER